MQVVVEQDLGKVSEGAMFERTYWYLSDGMKTPQRGDTCVSRWPIPDSVRDFEVCVSKALPPDEGGSVVAGSEKAAGWWRCLVEQDEA